MPSLFIKYMNIAVALTQLKIPFCKSKSVFVCNALYERKISLWIKKRTCRIISGLSFLEIDFWARIFWKKSQWFSSLAIDSSIEESVAPLAIKLVLMKVSASIVSGPNAIWSVMRESGIRLMDGNVLSVED